MKRDLDLIREILFHFEKSEQSRLSKSALSFDGYTAEQVAFHVEIMKEAGLLDHQIVRPRMGDGREFLASFDRGLRPTMKGYDFLESVRDPKLWARTKKAATAGGAFTLELVGEIAVGFVRKQIEDRSGVKL